MNRKDWVDRWKGLLIILVVIGHALGCEMHVATGAGQALAINLYKVIYLFHMPAFFCVAGYLWHDGEFLKMFESKVRRLMAPYLIFGLASVAIFCVGRWLFNELVPQERYYRSIGQLEWWKYLLALIHGGRWPRGDGFRPNSVLWFLPCMFLCSMVFWLIVRAVKQSFNTIWIWGIVFVVVMIFAIVSLYSHVSCWPFGAERVPYFLLFMIVGYVGFTRMDEIIKNKLIIWSLAIGGVLVYGVIAYLMRERHDTTFMEYWWFPIYFALSTLGAFSMMMLAKVLKFRWLATCGVASLGIMLIHKFIVVGMQFGLPIVKRASKANAFFMLLMVVLVSMFATIISYWCTKLLMRFCPFVIGIKGKK